MLESLLIGLIVSSATVYSIWALAPVATRRRLALRLAAALDSRATGGAVSWLSTRLRSMARMPTGGCGSCSAQVATPAERVEQDRR